MRAVTAVVAVMSVQPTSANLTVLQAVGIAPARAARGADSARATVAAAKVFDQRVIVRRLPEL